MRKRKEPKSKQWRQLLGQISFIATASYHVLRLILLLWDRFKH